MPATPLSLIFQAASNLTGGLVNDLTTAIIAVITLLFIALGLDYLIHLFKLAIRNRSNCTTEHPVVHGHVTLRPERYDLGSGRRSDDYYDDHTFDSSTARPDDYMGAREVSYYEHKD